MHKLIENTRRCDISFSVKGTITISARVSRALRLHRHDVLNICCDRGEYYLFVEGRAGELVGRRECSVYPAHGGRHMRANSARICRTMLSVTGCSKRARLVCGDPVVIEGRTMLPIITKYNLNQTQDG